MTARKLIGYGLIAGLTYSEVLKSPPGAVLDWYFMRLKYDDQQHGVKRKPAGAWEEE